jgi:hypothetical protein
MLVIYFFFVSVWYGCGSRKETLRGSGSRAFTFKVQSSSIDAAPAPAMKIMRLLAAPDSAGLVYCAVFLLRGCV